MLVDADHLLATPVFQANRCSLGFHYLHTIYAIAIYFVLLFLPKPFNIIGIGLLLHMLADLIDCMFMFDHCKACLANAPAFEVLKVIANFLSLHLSLPVFL